MLAPANRSLIMPRQRSNAERVWAPPSPGLAVFAAYFQLTPTPSSASESSYAARRRGESGDVSPPASAVRRRASGDETSDIVLLPCCQDGVSVTGVSIPRGGAPR